MNPKGKRILIGVLVTALICGVAGGGYYLAKSGSKDPVNVYSMEYIGMSGYWGDETSAYGPVTTDKVQSVYVSTTQIVNEVFVEEGQEVHVGDPLMSYDTTLSTLQLDSKGLEVQKLELSIKKAQEELKKIQNYRPGVPVSDAGSARGAFADDSSAGFLNASIGMLGPKLVALMTGETGGAGGTDPGTDPDPGSEELAQKEEELRRKEEALNQKEAELAQKENELVQKESGLTQKENELSQKETGLTQKETELTQKETDLTKREELLNAVLPVEQQPTLVHDTEGTEKLPRLYLWDDQKELSIPMLKFFLADSGKDDVWVALMVREGNKLMEGADYTPHLQTYLYEIRLENDTPILIPKGYLTGPDEDPLTIYSGEEEPSEPVPEEPVIDPGEIDIPSGITYTSAEIAKMRSDKELEIKSLEIDLKVAQVEYERLNNELNNGTVYSKIDGVVKLVGDAETAAVENSPLITVSGGGGYYINTTIGELDRETVQIGQPVTVNSWQSGGMYEGTVYSIGDLPVDANGYSGIGNSNVSYYPMVVFVNEDANLQEGEYVDLRYSAGQSEAEVNSLYLETMFVRTENGQSYCMVAGEDGTLEKRYISTGKNLWGNYVQIRSGLTMEDQVAFPYGKEVKEGAPTQEGNMEDFYNSMYQ